MADFAFLKKRPALSTLLVLEFLLFLVVSYQVRVDERLSLLEKMALMVLGPVQEVNHRVWGSISRTVEEKMTHEQLIAENRALREKLSAFNGIKRDYLEAEMENDRLRRLVDLPSEELWSYCHAEVIGRTHRRNDYMITISKGSDHGIQPEFGVIGPDGAVGIVWEVSPRFSKIMTINNPSAVVAALLQDSRYRESYVRGLDVNRARIENFPNFEPVKVGDLVLTSGMDRIFPKGLHVGWVTLAQPSKDLFQRVELSLATDFSRLELVTVLVPKCPEDTDELD